MRIRSSTKLTSNNDEIVIGTAALTEWDNATTLHYSGNGTWGVVLINYEINGILKHIYKHWQNGSSTIYKQNDGGYQKNYHFKRAITRLTTRPSNLVEGKYDSIDFMPSRLPSQVAKELMEILESGDL